MLFSRLIPRGAFALEVGAFILEKTNLLYDAIRQVAIEEAEQATEVLDIGVFRLNGHGGEITLDKTWVGLDQVMNIPPGEMPVSTLQQAALDDKFGENDMIPQANVTGLIGDLAQRVKTVNGNPPDVEGNVIIAGMDISTLIPRPAVEPEDSFLWYNGVGYYLIPMPDFVVSPDPEGLPDGATLRWDAGDALWVEDERTILPAPTGAIDGQVLTYDEATTSWVPLSLPATAKTTAAPFFIPEVAVGVRPATFIVPAGGAIKSMQALLGAGSGATVRATVNGDPLATSQPLGATVTTTTYDAAVAVGDRVQIEVVDAGTGTSDLSVTLGIEI